MLLKFRTIGFKRAQDLRLAGSVLQRQAFASRCVELGTINLCGILYGQSPEPLTTTWIHASLSTKATKEQGKRLEDAPAHQPRRILQQLLDEGVIGSLVSVSSAEVIAGRRLLQAPKGRVPLHFQAFCGRVNTCAAAGSRRGAWLQVGHSGAAA